MFTAKSERMIDLEEAIGTYEFSVLPLPVHFTHLMHHAFHLPQRHNLQNYFQEKVDNVAVADGWHGASTLYKETGQHKKKMANTKTKQFETFCEHMYKTYKD